MRDTPEYLAAVAHLADEAVTSQLPSYEVENATAGIAARFSVTDENVRDDVSDAMDRAVNRD